MANENPTRGEERIAAELLLKLGIRISPRTVRRYMPEDTSCCRGPWSQRWVTFVRNHAQGLLACDFFVSVTASFRVLYVFVIMEVGTRRIAHCNVTEDLFLAACITNTDWRRWRQEKWANIQNDEISCRTQLGSNLG